MSFLYVKQHPGIRSRKLIDVLSTLPLNAVLALNTPHGDLTSILHHVISSKSGLMRSPAG